MVIVLAASVPIAAERDQEDSFWEKLKNKIETLAPKKKTEITTAVGGVRGAKDMTQAMYWKGEEAEVEVQEIELEQFNLALEQALEGNIQESLKRFEDFLVQHPESPLREDAENAVSELKSKDN
jgi:TolA-binding protein